MDPRILILTQPGDVHAFAVSEALKHKGVEAVLWYTSDFPHHLEETVLFQGLTERISLEGPDITIPDLRVDTVWRRRPTYVIDESRLHPADHEFVDLQVSLFRTSLFNVLSAGAFWVNSNEAAKRAGGKLFQHKVALASGLSMPDTLYTNNPPKIREFIRRHGGTIVYKIFKGLAWRGEDTAWMPYTSLLTEKDLVEDELLRATPGIYQALVPKQYELRITVMGRHLFAAKVLSQATETGRLDWRKSYHELRMEPYKLPRHIADLCRKFLKQLGLVFGCLDFIVTPAGEYVFLEVNEMGQFLFIEDYAELPLLDAFSELLLQGRADFEWNRRRPAIRYSDVVGSIAKWMDSSKSGHVSPPENCWNEDAHSRNRVDLAK